MKMSIKELSRKLSATIKEARKMPVVITNNDYPVVAIIDYALYEKVEKALVLQKERDNEAARDFAKVMSKKPVESCIKLPIADTPFIFNPWLKK